MHRPSFLAFASFVALTLSTAACSIGLGDSTEGDEGTMHFEYNGRGCVLGCGLDRNALQGSLVTVAAKGGDGAVRKTARLTSGAVGTIAAQRETCSCETRTRNSSSARTVDAAETCAAGETKACTLYVDIETAQAGDAKLEVVDPGGAVIDRVTVHVRAAARIDVDVDVPGGGKEVGGVHEVRRGFKVKVRSEVFDGEGNQVVFTRHGVAHEYGDKTILKPDPAVILGSTDVEDMIATELGETTVKVRAEGAEQLLRFRVVP